jgi:trk system potassium uptake protein TrkA
VTVGELVRLMTLRQGQANLVEITLAANAPYVGRPIRDMQLPRDAALVAILRGGRVLVPEGDEPLETGDELLFLCNAEAEDEVQRVVSGDAEAL